MTISTAASILSYAGNGSTVNFAITWVYVAKAHVVATLRDAAGVETVQVLDTDYSLTDPGDTGTLTMTNAPATGETLVITSEPPNTQETDIPLGGSFPARSVEDALDVASQVSNKVDQKINRALIVPKTDLRSGSDLEIPNETDRASAFLTFGVDGKPTVTVLPPTGTAIITPFAETYLDDTTQAATLATLGAAGLSIANAFSGVNTFTGLSPLKFDGAVAGGNAYTFTFVEPTANRTITFPDADINIGASVLLESFVSGCAITPAGASASMPIAAGQVVDSTSAKIFSIAALTKTTAAWVVGTAVGGLDTGTIAADTWYHIFAIIRNDTGVTDYLFSLSATAPTLPADYDLFKRIGSWATDGSSQWWKGHSDGDHFFYDVGLSDSFLDERNANPGTSAVSETLAAVPTGIIVYPNMTCFYRQFGQEAAAWITSLTDVDVAPTTTFGNMQMVSKAAAFAPIAAVFYTIATNTSAQFRFRINFSDASTDIDFFVHGWRDPRYK